ncbi:hypothetical protein DD595_26275, partial [Enterobacter cloacae complex sp. 4DZ3-17B2]|uniref:hypothetical protein n=1 Tax=Enterobacter cloacae complex sp. 4DZ3-17B2 TaxID=2511990 RepID=UPI0010265629
FLRVVKFCLPELLYSVNEVISTNTFPSNWKHAIIFPLPKIREPKQLSDLRPISRLPILSKIVETISYDQMLDFFDKYRLLPEFQSGFRRGFSCETALLDVSEEVLAGWDKKLITVLCLLEFTRAFDT